MPIKPELQPKWLGVATELAAELRRSRARVKVWEVRTAIFNFAHLGEASANASATS